MLNKNVAHPRTKQNYNYILFFQDTRSIRELRAFIILHPTLVANPPSVHHPTRLPNGSHFLTCNIIRYLTLTLIQFYVRTYTI